MKWLSVDEKSMPENLVNIPCSLTIPCELKIPDNIVLDGNRYEFHIYAGVKPDNRDQENSGRLLCRVINKKPAPIIADGIASYYAIVRNGKVVERGNIGTSGCPMIVPNTNFVKDGFFTIDKIF